MSSTEELSVTAANVRHVKVFFCINEGSTITVIEQLGTLSNSVSLQ